MAKDIGIDLGTANTLIYMRGKGIVLNEPSVVAVNKEEGRVIAVGEEARQMLGRTPANILAIRPMRDGVIADYEATQAMLRYFIRRLHLSSILKPRVVVCIPFGITEVERRAVEEAVIQAGGKAAYLIEEPMAAAIGAGLSTKSAGGNLVVDIGGGTSEVAVISCGGIIASQSLRVAGDEMDAAIVDYVRREYNMLIGERTAETVKISAGSAKAYDGEDKDSVLVTGRDLVKGLPRTITLTAGEVRGAIAEQAYVIAEAVRSTLEKTPPELATDIMSRGILLTGGGALIRGIDALIAEETGIPVKVADNPLECVAVGTGLALSMLDDEEGALMTQKSRKWV